MKNMTSGSPIRLIFFFALPLMLGNILQQLYTMVDTMIVGQFVGVSALASIGAADWINWAILGIIMGFAQGFSIRISHAFGSQDYKTMKKTLYHIFILCALLAILITILAQIIIVPLLTLLNTPNHIIQGSITYLRVMSLGSLIIMAYNCFSSLLRALGNSRAPLMAMIVASLTNIVLDLIFVYCFQWGILGAGIATLIAQLLASGYCGYIFFKELPFTLSYQEFQLDISICKQLLTIGIPLSLQNLIISIGGIVVQSVVNGFGVLFVAGFTATNKLYGILEVAAISFGYAITTFTSQNHGAKLYQRMKQGIFQANLLSLITSVVIGLSMIVFGKDILMLFISGSASQVETVLDISYQYLWLMSVCLPSLYILYTYRSALQGMENTLIPMLSGIVELLMRIVIALFLPLLIGQSGIYYAEVSAWIGAAILLYIAYKYKIKTVMDKE